METFAGPVFASLRRSLGMTEKEYQHSLSNDGSYLQFISNSKSKADFFLTCVGIFYSSHLFKWENLHNWWLTKYFFAPLYSANIGKILSYSYLAKVYAQTQCISLSHQGTISGSF